MPVRAFIDNELASTLSHPLVASADIARRTQTRQDGYLRLRCITPRLISQSQIPNLKSQTPPCPP